jgi:hypothetical protein
VEKEVDHESDRQERLRLEGRKKKVEVLERVCLPLLFLLLPLSRLSSSISLQAFIAFDSRDMRARVKCADSIAKEGRGAT